MNGADSQFMHRPGLSGCPVAMTGSISEGRRHFIDVPAKWVSDASRAGRPLNRYHAICGNMNESCGHAKRARCVVYPKISVARDISKTGFGRFFGRQGKSSSARALTAQGEDIGRIIDLGLVGHIPVYAVSDVCFTRFAPADGS